jgi:hypothetical protein
MDLERILMIGLMMGLVVGCNESAQVSEPSATPATAAEWDSLGYCIPGETLQYLPQTAREYVVMCEPELGVPPQMDCGAGVTIPVTVDGVEATEVLLNFACDNPGLQAGGCVPGSTIHRVTGQTREGVERPEVTWVHFCRSEDGVSKGRTSTPTWDTVFTGAQMIGYNRETGATCFFELNVGAQEQWVGRDADNRASGVLPNYDQPEFDQAFIPGDQCVSCHENDPFAHNPWVDGARLPSSPDEAVLPALPANAPYYVVGGSDWDMRTIHIEGNGCLTCHRAGMALDKLYDSLGFDANQWMPLHAPGSLADDYAQLLDCHDNGPEQTPGCDWVVPPGGGCEGGVVGPDYPNAEASLPGMEKGDQGEGDEDDKEFEACSGGIAPEAGSACEGDWTTTLCLIDGEARWCEDGAWRGEDDK